METIHAEIPTGKEETIRITTDSEYDGVCIRVFSPNRLGDFTPTKKGLRIQSSFIDMVIDAMRKAQLENESCSSNSENSKT